MAYSVVFSMPWVFPLRCSLLPTTKRVHTHQTTWPRQCERLRAGSQEYTCWVSYNISQLQEYTYFQAYWRDVKNKNPAAFWRSTRFMHVLCSHCKCTPWICWRSWLHEHSLTYFSQNKLVSRDLLFKLSTLKHLILTESRFAVLLTDPGGQQLAAARRRLHGILFHHYSQI